MTNAIFWLVIAVTNYLAYIKSKENYWLYFAGMASAFAFDSLCQSTIDKAATGRSHDVQF